MKKILTLLFVLSLVVTSSLNAQITSNGTGGGNWSATTTWAGGTVPTGSGTITIASTDSIIFDVAVSITGTLVKQSAKKDSIGASGSLTFANGSTYQHATDGGSIPTATWSPGSTCLVTGTMGNAPSNASQNFYHFVWNCAGQSNTAQLGWNNNTIGGDLRVYNTTATGYQLRLTSGSFATNAITINGNVIVNGATAVLTTAGTGSPTLYTIAVTVKGNILDSAGYFILCNGSGGTCNWLLQGNLYIGPTAACTTNSTMTAPDSIIFAGTTKQLFTNPLASLANVRFSVRSGAILDMDTNRTGTSTNSTFTLEPGATVFSGHPNGLSGNLNCSGAKTLSKSANYAYDGVIAQTDLLLPDTVKNLTINNSAGFALSKATVVTGVLTLQAGQLDNSVNAVTIAPGGSVSFKGGSSKVPIPGWAPVAGFITNGTGGGVWNATSTWAGGVVPTTSDTIKIASTDSLIFNVPVTITGPLVKQSAKKDSISASGSLTFATGSNYIHAVNGSTVPLATWSNGSTCTLSGITSTMPSNMTQNFYNLTVNCPGYSGNLNFGWHNATITIGGTLTVTNTGYTHASLTTPNAQLRLFGGNGNCTINNIVINGYGGTMTACGSSYTDTINIPGNITISDGGALFLANNSTANCTWTLKGNLAIIDSGAISKSSSSNTSKILFAGTGTQTFTRPAGTWSTDVFLSGTNFEVANGSTLSFPGTKDTLSGTGSLKVNAGATIVCNHPLGIDGIVRMTGANGGGNSIAANSSFIFSGTSAQVTGLMMPDTVKNLTINNSAGVALSKAENVTGVLKLQAGQLNNTSPNAVTIVTGGSVVWTSGTTAVPIPGWPKTSVESQVTTVPQSFFVSQNYPNPFNPSTTISFGLPSGGFVTAKVYNIMGQEVATLFSGYKSAGIHELLFDASNLSSGIYLYRIQSGNSVDVKRMMLVK